MSESLSTTWAETVWPGLATSDRTITKEIRNQYFDGWPFGKIRDWLEENGLDRHMTIELDSVEIAVVTLGGVLLQIRADDNDQYGCFGGCLRAGEDFLTCAQRELYEETGIALPRTWFNQLSSDAPHRHQYANGDRALFHARRYWVDLPFLPPIRLDAESHGYVVLAHPSNLVLEHQRAFVNRFLLEQHLAELRDQA